MPATRRRAERLGGSRNTVETRQRGRGGVGAVQITKARPPTCHSEQPLRSRRQLQFVSTGRFYFSSHSISCESAALAASRKRDT